MRHVPYWQQWIQGWTSSHCKWLAAFLPGQMQECLMVIDVQILIVTLNFPLSQQCICRSVNKWIISVISNFVSYLVRFFSPILSLSDSVHCTQLAFKNTSILCKVDVVLRSINAMLWLNGILLIIYKYQHMHFFTFNTVLV